MSDTIGPLILIYDHPSYCNSNISGERDRVLFFYGIEDSCWNSKFVGIKDGDTEKTLMAP